MKPLTSKQLQRIEKKKKKMAAYLEIAKLNDKDREAKAVMHRSREESECSDADSSTNIMAPREEPRRKRHKKDDQETVDEVERNMTERSPNVPVSSESLCKPEPVLSQTNNLPPGFCSNLKGNSGKEQVYGDEYAKLKQELRERKNRLKHIPRFRLKEMGESALITVKEDDRTPLFLSDIQQLLMQSMLGHNSPYLPSRWCCLEKYNRISHTIVLVFEGLSLYDFVANESLFKALADMNKLEVITPLAYNGSLVEEMACVPLTSTHKNKLIKRFGSLEVAMKHKADLFKVLRAIFPVIESSWTSTNTEQPESDRYPRTHLLLSASQLVDEHYPVPLKGELQARYEEFVLTKDLYHEVSNTSPMFGLDCEMCRTTTGLLELTRVSIVNEQLEVVYETFVKPYNRITDYLTRFSGITKELLQDVNVRLEDVQRDIRTLLPPDAILVGQSLNFDLMALKMMHPYVIDTSVIFNITGDRFRKTKLQLLAHKFLGEEIQTGHSGHCSVEDSSACIKLTQLKLANDMEYGDAVLAGRKAASSRQRSVQHTKHQEVATSLFTHVTSIDKTAAIVGCQQIIDNYSEYMSKAMFSVNDDSDGGESKHVQCFITPNENVVTQMCNIAREHSFTLAHVQVDRTKCEDETKMIRQANKWCKAVWEHMAYNGLCVVLFSGQKGGSNGAGFIQVKRPPNLVSARL